MRVRSLLLLSALAGTLVAGCAHPGRVSEELAGVAPVSPLPVAVRVDFSSDVPDGYRVLSGPMETYQKLDVNGQVRNALEEYAQRKSGTTSGEPLVLSVRVDDFSTGFNAIGALANTTIPEEIQKSATLTLHAELRRGSQTLGERRFEEDTTVVERWDGPVLDFPNYDYRQVLTRVIRVTLGDVDAFVEKTVGSGG